MLADPSGVLPKAESITFRMDPPEALEVRLGNRRSDGYEVTLRAKGLGLVVIYVGKMAVGAVTIGRHESHLGPRAVDLLARVSNGSDARKIVAIQEILQNRAPVIIDQVTGPYGSTTALVCGSVAQAAGKALFGDVVHGGTSYHKKIGAHGPAPMTWDDLQYDPKVTQKGIDAIRANLDKGSAVRLGMVYEPKWAMLGPNGALQAERLGGHTILVVGYVDDQFLYLDPYPRGSRTTYKGGLPHNKGKTCNNLGVLAISHTRGLHLVAVVDDLLKPRLQTMEVISGP